MNKEYPFVFSNKYRVIRHLVFWIAHIVVFTFLFRQPKESISIQFLISSTWAVLFIIYTYPVLYYFIPSFLLKEKYSQFAIILLVWGLAGLLYNYISRAYFVRPLAESLGFNFGKNNWAPASFLTLMSMAGLCIMIVLIKYWIKKQHDYLTAEKEKVTAELQLLKAQVHPHFLFNTLNNIYSFSLKNSSKTPEMILKLSSLLSYMLYDCKANEVSLEKEIEIMKNYIDLEKERYANKLEVSVNVEGDIKGKYIAPLLLLPFLENAFKHGTSDQLEKPWLSMDVFVKQNKMRCKVVNSKNEMNFTNNAGIGIENVKKRLAYLYPGQHELKLNDEGNFFVVSLLIELKPCPAELNETNLSPEIKEETITI